MSSGLERKRNVGKKLFKANFIIFKSKLGNVFLTSYRNNAAIVLVMGNIDSNKVQGHFRDLLICILALLSSTENSVV